MLQASKYTLPTFSTFDYDILFDYQDDALGTDFKIQKKILLK